MIRARNKQAQSPQGAAPSLQGQRHEIGDKVFHGVPVGSFFKILREHFRHRVTITHCDKLIEDFGCVPPLVWFSRNYECAAGYGAKDDVKGFRVGEHLALDIDKPFRMVLEVRVNKDERLSHKHVETNDQHGYASESVRRITALYLIPVTFTAETVWMRKSYEEVDLTQYCNIEHLEKKMTEIIGPQELFQKQHFDPRAKQTKTPEEMRHRNYLVEKRAKLWQDQKELNDFHQRLLRSDGKWNVDKMNTNVQKLSKSVRSWLVEATGENRILASLDSISSNLDSDELARIPHSGRALFSYLGGQLLKRYQGRLKKAKGPEYTHKDQVCEIGAPDTVADRLKEEADRLAAQEAAKNTVCT